MDIIFNNLKPRISGAIKECSQAGDAVTYKIADEVHHIKTTTVEPGAEIAQDLSTVIDTIIKDSIRLGCDLSVISKGILVGAFRSNRSMQAEAHKTIRLLLQETVQSVFNYKGDINKTVDGILTGIVAIAQEHKLNVHEALIVAKEDILICAYKIDAKLGEDIKMIIQNHRSLPPI